ncbi:MAG: DNA modification methylase [Tannerella sp.]|nr:DNA modification methylase [Tannerella sp.]
MPVVRNPQFYFKEGFCWSNVLTTHIKCRQKQKTVHSTESMTFFSVTDHVPEYYLICMLNSRFVAYYVDSFVNATSHCTTGDAKLIPILVPTNEQLILFKSIFEKTLKIRINESRHLITEQKAELLLEEIQKELDIAVNKLYGIV